MDPLHDNDEHYLLNMTRIETNKHEHLVWGTPNLIFFLGEEWRDRASKAGQVSQPVQACMHGLENLSKLSHKHVFGGKVNVCCCHKNDIFFSHVQSVRFVTVNFFGHIHLLRFVIVLILSHFLTKIWLYLFFHLN